MLKWNLLTGALRPGTVPAKPVTVMAGGSTLRAIEVTVLVNFPVLAEVVKYSITGRWRTHPLRSQVITP